MKLGGMEESFAYKICELRGGCKNLGSQGDTNYQLGELEDSLDWKHYIANGYEPICTGVCILMHMLF